MIPQINENIAILHPVSLTWERQTDIIQDIFPEIKNHGEGLIHSFNVGDILKHNNIYNLFIKDKNEIQLDNIKECLIKVRNSISISNIDTLLIPKDGWGCKIKAIETLIKEILPEIKTQVK